jgi:hypothetical protein
VLHNLETHLLQEFLADAVRLGADAATATLEAELFARGVFGGVATEPPFPLTFIRDDERRRAVAIVRLRNAAARADVDCFRDNLVLLDPANVAEAWRLSRVFDVEERADLLSRITFWFAAHLKGAEAARQIINAATADKTAEEIVESLERDFALIFGTQSEVQDA